MATIECTALDVTPNNCALDAGFELSLTFTSDAAVAGAKWDVSYMVDMTGRRHVVQVGSTDPADVVPGENTMKFSSPGIDLSGAKKSWLQNVGLLLIVLKAPDGAEIVQVSLVTQITKQGDQLVRTMLNPLE